MLKWALVFLIAAFVSAVLGYGGVAVSAAAFARLVFVLCLALFMISVLLGLVRRAGPT